MNYLQKFFVALSSVILFVNCIFADIIDEFLYQHPRSISSEFRLIFPYGKVNNDGRRVSYEHRITKDFFESLTVTPLIINGIQVKKLDENEVSELIKVQNMQALFREIWGESDANSEKEFACVFDEKKLEKSYYLLRRNQSEDHSWSLQEVLSQAVLQKDTMLDLQRLLINSLLCNPRDADKDTYEVSAHRIRPGTAFKEIGVPFVQTRGSCEGVNPHYQLAVFNYLYAEFFRENATNSSLLTSRIADTLSRSIVSRTPEEILLNWLSWPLVRESLIGGNENIGVSYLDYFIRAFNAFKEYLSKDTSGDRNLLEWIKDNQFAVYRAYFSQSRTPSDVYKNVFDRPAFISDPESHQDAKKLANYEKFGILGSVKGWWANEDLIDRVLIKSIEENSSAKFNRIADNYMYSHSEDWKNMVEVWKEKKTFVNPIKLRSLSPARRTELMERLFTLLGLKDANENTFKFAVLLGLDINKIGRFNLSLGEESIGCSLLHYAVDGGDLDKIKHLSEIPWIKSDNFSAPNSQKQFYTPLDVAIYRRNTDVFMRLVSILKAGAQLQFPESAFQWYMSKKSEFKRGQLSQTDENLRMSFSTLARRHQKLRWSIVLEEVFPRALENEQLLASKPDQEAMLRQLTQEMIKRGLNDIQRVIVDTCMQQIDANDALSQARAEAQRQLQNHLLSCIKEKGELIDLPHHYTDPVIQSVNLGLQFDPTSETKSNIFIKSRRDKLLGAERIQYLQFCTKHDMKHLADATELKSIQAGFERSKLPADRLSLHAFYSRPLLVEFFETATKQKISTFANGTDKRQLAESILVEIKQYWDHCDKAVAAAAPRWSITVEETSNKRFDSIWNKYRQLEEGGNQADLLIEQAFYKLVAPKFSAEGAESGRRILTAEIRSKLWCGNTFTRTNKHGLANVQYIGLGSESLLGEEGVIYIKEYPSLPGFEAAVHKLLLPLIGGGVPYSELFKIEGIPYLFSQGFIGDNILEEYGTNPERLKEKLSKVDSVAFSKLLLGTILVSPEDGKLDNHVICTLPDCDDAFQVVSIDNDHAFTSLVGSEKLRVAAGEKHLIQLNSCLFGFTPQLRKHIPEESRTIFSKTDAMELFKRWVEDLCIIDASYNRLFPGEKERLSHWHSKLCCLTIPLTPQMLMNTYDRFILMQRALNQPHVYTHVDLMHELFSTTLASTERYGKHWTSESPLFGFLEDPIISSLTTSQITSFAASHRIPMQSQVEMPIEKRPYSAAKTLKEFSNHIKNIETALKKKGVQQ